ncbi:MAG TPA: lysylphosphatidylglycerol synthase transmembrane domain-containing protein [Candidatus Binataceae bacterium]|nr:lysylphosphatidylglycerol synthase transmembrane domain-containing protein [Candidatus Binataceae bacterium]
MAEPSARTATNVTNVPNRRKSYGAFALRAGLGAAAVGFLLWRYDPRPILYAIARERIGFFAAAVALYVAGQALSAWRWQWLAQINALPRAYPEYLRYYFIGVFTNLFVPGLIGGDAARAVYLGRRHRRLSASIASVVADRGIGLVSLVWFAAVAAVAFSSIKLPEPVRKGVLIVGTTSFAGWLIAAVLTRWAEILPAKLTAIVRPISPYLERPLAIVPAIALSLILQASLAGCQYLIALGLGLTVPLTAFLVCVPIANVVASLPLTLNGLGLRETAYLVLLGGIGISHPDAIAMGLLWFAATMTGGLTGVIAFATTEMPSAA